MGQECAVHREKSKQCGATGSVAETCCEGLICNNKKQTCKQEKCAKVFKRAKECGSPSGLNKCCEGLICSKKLRRCIEPPAPTMSPTTNPTVSPTVLVTPDKGCTYQSENLGTSYSTPEQCMAVAKAESGCTGNEIMWSNSYNKLWGCRCCSKHPTCPPASSRYHSNSKWDVYKYEECS